MARVPLLQTSSENVKVPVASIGHILPGFHDGQLHPQRNYWRKMWPSPLRRTLQAVMPFFCL